MYITDLKLSTKVTNALTRANINSVERLSSFINEDKIRTIPGLNTDVIVKCLNKIWVNP